MPRVAVLKRTECRRNGFSACHAAPPDLAFFVVRAALLTMCYGVGAEGKGGFKGGGRGGKGPRERREGPTGKG